MHLSHQLWHNFGFVERNYVAFCNGHAALVDLPRTLIISSTIIAICALGQLHCQVNSLQMLKFAVGPACRTLVRLSTVDRRLSCNSGIEYQYYQSVYKMGSTEQHLDLCAFCGTTLSASDASKLKKLLADGHKVLPSCGAKDCLGMNPKANHLNGWTLTEKQTRKRKRKDQPPKKPKKTKPAVKQSAKKKS